MIALAVLPEPTQESLAALVTRRLNELGDESGPLSYRRAAARSSGLISGESIRRAQFAMSETSDRALKGIALALEVPVAEVYRAAGVPRPDGPWVLPERFERVPLRYRPQFEALIASFLEALESDGS